MSHVGLAVSDLEASTRFYADGLGFVLGLRFRSGDEVAAVSEVTTPVRMTSQHLTRDGFVLGLMSWEMPAVHGTPSQSRNQRGITHLSFEVDDIRATETHLLALGGTRVEGARVRFEGPTPVSLIFLADPDGTRIELVQRSG